MRITFVVQTLAYLKYFMPLIEIFRENKTNEICIAYHKNGQKYNSPTIGDNFKVLEKTELQLIPYINEGRELNGDIETIKTDIFVTIEGLPFLNSRYHDNVFAITYMTDYTYLFEKYYKSVNAVFLPSKWMSTKISNYETYDLRKIQYLGSPKYDCIPFLKKESILEKYTLQDDKFFLIISPNTNEIEKSVAAIKTISIVAKNNGYKTILKGREKHTITAEMERLVDYIFFDLTWYPPTTLELIYISDVCFNFDSTTVKEIILLDKPCINFRVKSYRHPFEELFNAYPNINLKPMIDNRDMEQVIFSRIGKSQQENKNNYFFVFYNSSKKIYDYILNKG